MRPPDDPELASWLDKAGEDLLAVDVLLPHAARLHAVVCFHCQQAAEKLLKAVHVALGLRPPRTHDLTLLLEALLLAQPQLKELEESADFLKGFAILPRYPLPIAPGAEPEGIARSAVEHARRVERAVHAAIGPTCRE